MGVMLSEDPKTIGSSALPIAICTMPGSTNASTCRAKRQGTVTGLAGLFASDFGRLLMPSLSSELSHRQDCVPYRGQ